MHDWTGLLTLTRREILRYFVVSTQTLLPPIVSSSLFIFVFGFSLGRNFIETVQGVPYIQFMIPGLVMMHLIESSYTNASSSLFISRWHNMIQELLLSPMSYVEIVIGLLIGSMTRGILVGIGVYLVSFLFAQFPIHSPALMIYFFIVVTFIFSCLGLLVGLWAEGFEKLSFMGTFLLTPLIYFGGVFHGLEMVPAPLKIFTQANPIFYLVNGLRYAMIGVKDVPLLPCILLPLLMGFGLFLWVESLFRSGYRLRT